MYLNEFHVRHHHMRHHNEVTKLLFSNLFKRDVQSAVSAERRSPTTQFVPMLLGKIGFGPKLPATRHSHNNWPAASPAFPSSHQHHSIATSDSIIPHAHPAPMCPPRSLQSVDPTRKRRLKLSTSSRRISCEVTQKRTTLQPLPLSAAK